MFEALLKNEAAVRMFCFIGVFAVMAEWEAAAPLRQRAVPRWLRWSNNLGLVAVDSLIVRLAFPVMAVEFAAQASAQGWGLLNNLDLAFWPALVLSLLLLDLAIYLQHAMFHAIPALWRLHRVHHADTEFDVTTALRFHPLEIILSMAFKLAVVAALGPPAVAVLVFEIVLNAAAMFNHSNFTLPGRIDRVLRLFIVTPDMHRVHHSSRMDEHNRNFGFNLPWWDYLLGTYRAEPQEGQAAMTIGLDQFRDRRELGLDAMLTQPFRNPS